MSDHNYFMQTIHQQVGYNQPNHIGGYFLGNGMDLTAVPTGVITGIREIQRSESSTASHDGIIYDLSGRRVRTTRSGMYIRDGKKFIMP